MLMIELQINRYLRVVCYSLSALSIYTSLPNAVFLHNIYSLYVYISGFGGALSICIEGELKVYLVHTIIFHVNFQILLYYFNNYNAFDYLLFIFSLLKKIKDKELIGR